MYGIKVLKPDGSIWYIESSRTWGLTQDINSSATFSQLKTVIAKIKEFYTYHPDFVCYHFVPQVMATEEVLIKRKLENGYIVSWQGIHRYHGDIRTLYYGGVKTKTSDVFGRYDRYSPDSLIGKATRFKSESDAKLCMESIIREAHKATLTCLVNSDIDGYVSSYKLLVDTISVTYYEDK